MVSIPACHAGDRGSIPRRGACTLFACARIDMSSKLYHRRFSSEDNDYILKDLKFGVVLDSIVVSIPACHAGDRGSIPRRGALFVI